MNELGLAVRKVLARDRAPLTEMLVVVDDFALPFGKLRFREGGGPGGHNGLRSIIGELESEAFSRLRVGIGAPNDRFIDHVLTKFEPDERQRLDELLDAAADAVEAWAARARTRRRRGSTRSTCDRRTRTWSRRRARSTGRRARTGSGARRRAGERSGQRADAPDGVSPATDG